VQLQANRRHPAASLGESIRTQGRPDPTPLPRRRIGRGALLAWIKAQIGAGGITLCAEEVAARFPPGQPVKWRLQSARDALQGLVCDGLLEVSHREPPHGKIFYRLTAAGAAAKSKRCRTCGMRKVAESFWPSRWTDDGLAEHCKVCVRAREQRQHDARRAARVAP
jgi:hypothetical protein